MKYALPVKALEQHIIVLGKTRSGKSSAMRSGFVEPLLGRDKPVCIIDPKGDWWGLKSSADGQAGGYPVVIFGGDHADVPINEHSGSAVAELVATGNRSCIIDLGGWMVGERTRFFVAFASALFKHTRGQRWLIIDECHNFAPQSGGIKNVDRNKMLHWANRLASEGLGRGINLIAASQRPQKVHKDFVTSMETLIAMRVIHPLDRGAVKDWIDGCGDPAMGKEIIGSLAGLERGDAWVWSPEIGYGPKRQHFKLFTTYDSFAVRKADEQELKGWASVDLDEVREKLAESVAEAEANDPKLLKAKIRELQGALHAAPGPERSTEDNDFISRLQEQATALKGRISALERYILLTRERQVAFQATLVDAIESISAGIDEYPEICLPKNEQWSESDVSKMLAQYPPEVELKKIKPMSPKPVADRIKSNGAGDGLTGPQRRILNSLAWWEVIGIKQPENVSVATMAGYSAKGSAYKTPRSQLSTLGLIRYPTAGSVELTNKGREMAEFPDIIPSGTELRREVVGRLTGPQRRILQPLLEAYPESMENGALAAAADYSPDGSAYKTPRSQLSSLGLIEYPSAGKVTARDFLFPELTK